MYKLPDGEYCAYLRKSRADLEAEARGEEDTYARHERILFDLAKYHGILITHVYREKPITGERISARPEMMQLLADVEDGRWTGVLVVEVERLARGDTMDQGIVAQAFKYSNTLIVTPMRIYDPSNPDDEEYFEFGLFMSRREFKTITRRLQSGRISSVKEGKYVGNRPPYGYVRVKYPHGKGYTLEPHPEQSPVVKLIFSLYTDPDPEKRMGTGLIARHLNNLRIPSATGGKWTIPTLVGILRNPVYAGYVRWGSRPQVKRRDGMSRPRKPEDQWILVRGLHQPIVDEETFRRAQEIMREHSHPPAPTGKISNPLAGLIRCDMCGGSMVLRPYSGKNEPMIICPRQGCKNVGSYFHYVEDSLLQSLKDWLSSYKAQWEEKRPRGRQGDEDKLKAQESVVRSLRRKLDELHAQKNQLHDLLERRIYTVEVFLERSQILAQRIEAAKAALDNAEQELEMERKRMEARSETIPKVEHVLEVYHKTDDPAHKNTLLRSVLEYAVYRKERGGRWSGLEDQFTLTLFPKLPR
ncbi:MAG TPA: recombinase family protein [Alicyclobacillus sp.]|nr:recombinase family protein [Alicyclobacillus sp.]